MRGVLWVLLMLPVLLFGQFQQYVDTINGKITVVYNQPNRMKVSVLAGGGIESQTTDGAVVLPAVFADVHLRPLRWLTFHGAITQQYQFGWQFQNITDTRNLEVGARLFFKPIIIEKYKTFTAGSKAWKYDFEFPVKVLWNLGLSGSYRFGTGIFNTGINKNTGVRFRNQETNQLEFLETAAIPYTFSEVSGGFVVNTSTAMKVRAHLPTGTTRTKRMKTYTEFRLEAVYANQLDYNTVIARQAGATTTKIINYDVVINNAEKWGFKLQGLFRRRWIGFKVEAGVRPGIYYRFSDNPKQSPLIDRSYYTFGVGFGWM